MEISGVFQKKCLAVLGSSGILMGISGNLEGAHGGYTLVSGWRLFRAVSGLSEKVHGISRGFGGLNLLETSS